MHKFIAFSWRGCCGSMGWMLSDIEQKSTAYTSSLDIGIKQGSYLNSHGVEYYYEKNREVYNQILEPRLSKRWKSKSLTVQFREIAHSIRNDGQYLGLGKCQPQDFDAQIASITLCMMQYNTVSVIKRFHDYETIGELFRATHKGCN